MENYEDRYEYILVLPNGDIKGFDDYAEVKGYVNIYYRDRVKNTLNNSNAYNELEEPESITKNICIPLGVKEGECKVYLLDSLINTLQESMVFDDEKEEIITKLASRNIHLNIYDYGLDQYFIDTEEVNIIEQFGEI